MFSPLTEWFHDASHFRSIGCVNRARVRASQARARESRNLQIKLARGNQSHFAPESHLIRNVMHIGRYVFRLFVALANKCTLAWKSYISSFILRFSFFAMSNFDFRFGTTHWKRNVDKMLLAGPSGESAKRPFLRG